MKQVFTLSDSAELGLLKSILEDAGIRCAVRNEQMSQTLPAAPFNAELWVENDEDFQRAHDLYETWHHPQQGATGAWVCPGCGERLNLQFDSCWKCGTHRAAAANLNQQGEAENENICRGVD